MEKAYKTVILLLILLLIFALAALIFLVSDIIEERMYPDNYANIVKKYASEYGVDEYLIHSVIWVESGYDRKADSRAGARGLMQISKGTLSDINRMLGENYSFYDMYDPEKNIRCGVCYLSYLIKRFGDKTLAIAAYNAGPGNVSSWMKKSEYYNGKTLYNIPFPETKTYVNKVLMCCEKYKELYK